MVKMRDEERRKAGSGPAKRRVGVLHVSEETYVRLMSLSIAVDKPMVALVRRAVVESLPRWEEAVQRDRMALL